MGADAAAGSRKKVLRKFKLRSFTLRVDALDEVLSFFSCFPDSLEDALDLLIDEIDHVSLKSNILDKDSINHIISLLLEADSAVQSEDAHRNGTAGTALRVVDAFLVTKFRFDPTKKQFFEHADKLPIHGCDTAKAALYRDRFQLLHQRISRDEHFSRPVFYVTMMEAGVSEALDMDGMKQKIIILTTERNQLEVQNKALLEETSYAKGLASASGMELKTLSRQVGKLMKQNERLATELATLRNANRHKASNVGKKNVKQDGIAKRYNRKMILEEMDASYEQQLSLESALRETQQKEAELQKIVDELKKKESYLENELASMWVLVGKLRGAHGIQNDEMELRICEPNVAQLLSTPFSY